VLDTVALGKFIFYIVTLGQIYVEYSVTGIVIANNMKLGQIYVGQNDCGNCVF
jgi:hypothetical protein